MFRKLKNSELVRLSVQQYRDAAKEPFVLVLDNVRSQHNIGSAFRTCDAFRIGRICLCGISATPPTPEIHKAALGAEFSVDWVHFDTALEAVAALRAENYTIVSVEQAEHATQLQDFRPEAGRRYAFVFGNEALGISSEALALCDDYVQLPAAGLKNSINVGNCAAVILFEALRQYRKTSASQT